MKFTKTHGLELSRFSLGTVQLGMDYGIGEDKAKPSEEKAFAVLDRAMDRGINSLDTANNYGDSEKVIGRWLEKRRAEGKKLPWIVTKVGPLDHGSPAKLRDDVLYQTEGCLKTLGVDRIDCLMLHNFEDYEQDPRVLSRVFQELKDQKIISTSGISAYSRHDYGLIADSGFDAVQIPLNVFDWGQIENGGIGRLADAGMMIFIRSVFLQGLVFHTPEDLDPRLDFCVPPLCRYLELCKEFSLAPDVLALSFVLSVPGVCAAVLGCDNAKQLDANADLTDRTVTLTKDQLALIREAFVNIDPRVINPGVWYNHT